jgi:transcriptional regulator with XRE-family HTH domain
MREATPEELAQFGAALADALIALGIDQKDFAVEMTREVGEPVSKSSVSQWAGGVHEPTRAKVFAMERLLKLKPGTLSRHMGYLPASAKDVKSVLDAIDADPKLSEGTRFILRASYNAALQAR